MQSKKTPGATSKKPAKKTTRKVSKKTSKKPVRRVPKKTARKSSKKVSAAPAEGSPKPVPEQRSGKQTRKTSNRPILVAVDFSDYSKAALKHAVVLSDCMQAPIAVLHVVHDPGDAPGYYQVKGRKKQLRRLEDVARDMLDEFMDRFVKRHPKHAALQNAERLLVTGLPVNRILEVAQKLRPGMMVIGSAGRTGLSRFLLGSKAEQLIRVCPFSITVVKLPNKKS
jgi:nucleotide-binding universal stress UspA family protein